MHLINSLSCGIAVAAAGTCILNRRGTAARASYYRDFEASQTYTAQPITLDSSGSVVLYVNELVDVLVYDATGVLVREFVAGDSDNGVEVISPSFTGVSYSDGSSGVNKPTTLGAVLDLWVGSAGTPDFKVIPSGTSTPVTLAVATAALSGLFFNVKSYGAIGNGAADDGTAIQAAITAAAATSTAGGTVFFPPGTYRSTTGLTLTSGVSLLGSGDGASRVFFESAAAGLTINAGTNLSTVSGLKLNNQTTNNASALVAVATAGRTHFQDCTVSGDVSTGGNVVSLLGTGVASETSFSRCRLIANTPAAAPTIVQASAGGVVRFVDCDITNAQTNGVTHVAAADGVSIRGCRFSADGALALATTYVDYTTAGTIAQACEVIGNFFSSVNAGVVPVAIKNSQAVPARDVVEYGNTFGAAAVVPGAIVPYSYTTDGYASLAVSTTGYHGSRSQLRQLSGASTPLQCNPKICGETVINWTAGAALTLQTTLGTMGDVWVLYVINTSGGVLTVTPSGQMILDAAAGTFTVANNGTKKLQFAWLPTLGGVGFWQQMAPSATS